MKKREILESAGLRKFRGGMAAAMIATTIALLLPAAANAGWSASQPVSGEGTTVNYMRMDGTSDGSAFAVWVRSVSGDDLIQGVKIGPDGQAGEVITLSTAGQDAESPDVAIHSDGSATAVWSRSNGANDIIQSARISPQGEKGPVLNRSATGGDAIAPSVAYAGNGTVGIAWRRDDGTHYIAQSRLVFDDGSADSVRDLSTSVLNAREVSIVPLPEGQFRVVWVEGSNEANGAVKSKKISATGTPGPMDDVAPSGGSPNYVDVDANGDGDVVVVWQRYNDLVSHWGAAMSRIPADGPPSQPIWVAPIDRDAFDPTVAVSGAGVAFVAWTAFDQPLSDYFLEAARVDPQDTVGEVISFAGANQGVGYPSVDSTPAGWTSIAWIDAPEGGVQRLLSSRISPAGVAGETIEVAKAPVTFPGYPQVAVADDGVAISTFFGSDGPDRYVWSSRFTDPGAAITGSGAFGDRLVDSGPGEPRAFQVVSSGSTPNDIQAIGLAGPGASQFNLTGAEACVGNHGAGSECPVSVTFDPDSPGDKQATLQVTSSAGETSIALTGKGTVPVTTTGLALKVKPAAKKIKRGRKAKVKVTVRNTGTVAATAVKVCFSGKARIVKPKKKCFGLGSVAVAGMKAKNLKIGLSKKAKRGKRYPVKFKLTAANAPAKKARVKIRAK